jgi:hypothetical protein
MTNTAATTTDQHSADCKHLGFRYGATIKRTPATIENGTAGKVVMLCKSSGCSARRIV